jgi:hypothetical protein
MSAREQGRYLPPWMLRAGRRWCHGIWIRAIVIGFPGVNVDV